jgi:hypothetical protein
MKGLIFVNTKGKIFTKFYSYYLTKFKNDDDKKEL